MDQWLTNIAADTSHRSQQQKVIADKPAGLGDGCYLSATNRIVEQLTDPASGQCGALYPVAANTRLAAGQPLSQNGPEVPARAAELRRLRAGHLHRRGEAELRSAFPHGVCDYSEPGVGQQRPRGVWLDYSSQHGR